MGKVTRFGRSHPWVTTAAALVVVLCGAAAWTAWRVWRELDVPFVEVSSVVPVAPRLVADEADETVYRVDASRSKVSYEIEERIAGISRTTVGSTSGVAGDIALDRREPSASRLGEIVVDLRQLTSDEELRDQRIRHDFLESLEYPLATFVPTSVAGLPGQIAEGEVYDLTIDGKLTVKETTAPVTVDATATVTDGQVRLDGSTEVKLSTFDAGPIRLLGFVSTSDDVTLRFQLVFVDPARFDVPTVLVEDEEEAPTPVEGVAFSSTVQPILEESCASCHGSGGAGSEVWTLDSAGDAAAVASGLKLVTQSGYMPPWPASDTGIPLAHARGLADEDLEALVAWADAGGPLDVDPATSIDPAPSGGPALRRDIELVMPEPYAGSTSVPNDYRCFVLDPAVAETTYVSGYEFEPDTTEVVHHALVFRVSAEGAGALAAADAAAPGPGWQCYSGIGVGAGGLSPTGRTSGVSQFMAWAPGQDATRLPQGTAMRLEPGELIVLQVHYHYGHSAPPDRSTLVLERSDTPPGEVREVAYDTYLAPAEIPCTPAEQGPLCDRGAAIADLVSRYGPSAALIAEGLHLLCGSTPGDFTGMTSGVAQASCVHVIDRDADLLAVFGHMHEIGKAFRMTLNPGTPDEKVLLDIPTWDFGWQLNYEPADRVELRAGDTLRIECTWDRSLLPAPEARYITWAEGTEDEMCYSALTTVPRD